jgi:hypothetical protein
MADTTQPNLGYGQRGEAPIDAVNQWMRSQPWYQQQLAAWGQNPNGVKLNDDQKQQIVRLAQAHGVVIDEGHNGQEVDDSGNFQAKSHKLRNTLIVGGIAGAALLTAGLAGAFAPSATAGLAGVEGGSAGLSSSALAGLGTGAMSAVPVASGIGTTAAGIGAGTAAFDAAGNFIGPSTFSGIGSGGGSSILGTLGKLGDSGLADTLTQGSQGLAGGRRFDNQQNMQAADINNRTGLAAASFNAQLPSTQASQVARGDLLSGMKDTPLTGDPRIDKFSGGGLRPSAFGPDTHAAGDALKKQALQNLLSGGGKFVPQNATPNDAGFGENALAGAGMGLNILGALRRVF